LDIQTQQIGNRIKQLLNNNNITQTKLSEETGISQNAISNYINGNRVPDAKALIKLSSFFSISIDWLLTGKNIASKSTNILEEYLELNKELKEKGFTPEDIRKLLKAIETFYDRNNSQ